MKHLMRVALEAERCLCQQFRGHGQIALRAFQAQMAKMSRETRKQALHVCTCPIPCREAVHCEGVAEIMQPRLIASVLTLHTHVSAEPEERIFKNVAGYGAAILISEEQRGVAASMPVLPAIVVVLREHAA
jgi:hypothetical protein